MSRHKIAIVGAGMSGISVARTLCGEGFDVQIFEKSRGYGGRMATRRASGFEFDHGAQYFTARESTFRKSVVEWIREGVAAVWRGRISVIEAGQTRPAEGDQLRYVGTPRMNSVVRHLAQDIEIEFGARIISLEKNNRRWRLISERAADPVLFDSVILTIPPSQASELLAPSDPLQRGLKIPMHPCWAMMLVFEHRLAVPFDAAFVNESIVSWISRNSSKPGRGSEECWVVHASPDWSRRHLEEPPEQVAEELSKTFFQEIGVRPLPAVWQKVHRWRYAQALEPLSEGCFWDAERRVGLCGDWCSGSRVEGAFLSGKQIAEKIIDGS